MIISENGKEAIWVTERSQLPTGEWIIKIWIKNPSNELSHDIHKKIANLMTVEMNKTIDKS